MTATLTDAARIEFEYGIATECEHQDCWSEPEHAFVLTGDAGRDGVGVYCHAHAQAKEDDATATYLGTVEVDR